MGARVLFHILRSATPVFEPRTAAHVSGRPSRNDAHQPAVVATVVITAAFAYTVELHYSVRRKVTW
jgi:hypothetical protein